MKEEYDFRFQGLDLVQDSARVRELRAALLELAGGFTEINPGTLTELIPGDGLGYIAALEDHKKLEDLNQRLEGLAKAWNLPVPSISPASDGPRSHCAFFLIPRLANRDETGRRRNLFSPEKWARLKEALQGKLSYPVQLVYGEWLPQDSSRGVDQDASFIFVFKLASGKEVEEMCRFIEREVFDGGKECDQEVIYLSIGGMGTYVYDPSASGDS